MRPAEDKLCASLFADLCPASMVDFIYSLVPLNLENKHVLLDK